MKCYVSSFGMLLPGRTYSAGNGYRYGFNKKEVDNETEWQDYGMRVYDDKLSRFFSPDPITARYPDLTPYQFASNRPIDGIDQDGLEWYKYLYWAIFPETVVPTDKEIAKGFAERAKTTWDGLRKAAKNWDKFLPKIVPGGIDPKGITQKTNLKLIGALAEGMQNAFNDYKDLISRAVQGDKQAIGAVIFEAILLFTPGVDELGGAIKGLSYAGKSYRCVEYAGEFVSKIEPMLAKVGATVERFEIKIVDDGVQNGIIGTTTKQLTDNGLHQYVVVTTKEGTEMVFDNLHPTGVLKSDYIKELSASIPRNGKILDGDQLIKEFTKKIPNKSAKKTRKTK